MEGVLNVDEPLVFEFVNKVIREEGVKAVEIEEGSDYRSGFQPNYKTF